jgi:hypothetical protein
MDIGESEMVKKVRHCFVLNSAINTKFGVFRPDQRLQQTLDTIRTIRDRMPDAKIVIVESAGTSLTQQQEQTLITACDKLIDYTRDEDVQSIYLSDNHDIVKNCTEIMCFSRALQECLDDGFFSDVDRVHKMSGRYLLNDQYSLELYENNPNKIIIGPKHTSQFPFEVTGIKLQYMARLWSWPTQLTEKIIEVYQDSLAYIADRIANGGYADIEHVLYRFLPVELVLETPVLGVEGGIAPNGMYIKN